jgi:hypothetical protein
VPLYPEGPISTGETSDPVVTVIPLDKFEIETGVLLTLPLVLEPRVITKLNVAVPAGP